MNVITFNSTVTKNVTTRAVTSDNLSKFYTFGGHVKSGASGMSAADVDFYDIEVSKSSDGTWLYATESYRYWVTDAIYNFYAYSCDNGRIPEGKGKANFYDFDTDYTVVGNSGNLIGNCTTHGYHYLAALTITDYICDATNQADLVYASQSYFNNGEIKGLASSNPKVALTFQHLLSQIRVTFKTEGINSYYTTTISDVSIDGFYNKADYKPGQLDITDLTDTLSQLTWRGHSTDGNPVFNPKFNDTTNPFPISTTQINSGFLYVIPATYPSTKQVTIHFTAKLSDKNHDPEEVITTKKLKATFTPAWQAGHSYSYNFVVKPTDLDLGVIEFTTTENGVTGWTTVSDTGMTIEADT
jgi:hypothetical protein